MLRTLYRSHTSQQLHPEIRILLKDMRDAPMEVLVMLLSNFEIRESLKFSSSEDQDLGNSDNHSHSLSYAERMSFLYSHPTLVFLVQFFHHAQVLLRDV